MTKNHKILFISLILCLGFANFSIAQQTEGTTTDENIKAQDLGVGDPTILPDSPIYFLKEWGRGFRSFLAFDPTTKAELESKFANEKLIEIKKMVEANKPPAEIEEATDNYQNNIEKVKKITERIKEKAKNNQKVGGFLDRFTQHQALHQRLLQRMENKVPPQAQTKIKQVRKRHLQRFKDVIMELEDKEGIPERLERNLRKIKGSRFQEIKNLQLLDELKGEFPEEVQEKIEQKKEAVIERLRGKMEDLSPEQKEKLEKYLSNVSGDETTMLDIFNALETKGLSEDLEKIIKKVKEQKVENIANRFQETVRQRAVSEERAGEKIKEAEDSLTKLQELIAEKEAINQEEMPAVFRLLKEAEEKLDSAKKEFEEGNYGRAFGQATASLSLSRNALRIIDIRAGFSSSAKEDLVCAEVYNPVCGEDGKTYGNICKAKQAGVKVSYRGKCEANLSCAKEGEKVNRNPLLGPVNRKCCEGLEEIRTSRSYSVCRKPDTTFECQEDEDCPLPRCPGMKSRCVNGSCVIPRCKEPVACIQVITPAKNPNTGQCREFPTPCDVPEGWVKVEACGDIRSQLKETIQNKIQSLTPSDKQ